MSSDNITANVGELVNLLCSAQGEPPITFTWKKDQRRLDSFTESQKPHRSSILVVRVKDSGFFGKYICHIQDRFGSTTHTIWILRVSDTGNSSITENNYVIFAKMYSTLMFKSSCGRYT
jgi:hypothetical protein